MDRKDKVSGISHSDYESGATNAVVLLYTLFTTYNFLARSGQSVYD